MSCPLTETNIIVYEYVINVACLISTAVSGCIALFYFLFSQLRGHIFLRYIGYFVIGNFYYSVSGALYYLSGQWKSNFLFFNPDHSTILVMLDRIGLYCTYVWGILFAKRIAFQIEGDIKQVFNLEIIDIVIGILIPIILGLGISGFSMTFFPDNIVLPYYTDLALVTIILLIMLFYSRKAYLLANKKLIKNVYDEMKLYFFWFPLSLCFFMILRVIQDLLDIFVNDYGICSLLMVQSFVNVVRHAQAIINSIIYGVNDVFLDVLTQKLKIKIKKRGSLLYSDYLETSL